MAGTVHASGPTLAAALFTDIVGSTAARSQFGDDLAEQLRRAHDRLVEDAVQTRGGTVVKGLGDGAMAIFGGASEAVEAAVAVQQGAQRLVRREAVPIPLELRIGVSVGEVIWENDDCFGMAVIEASRLCQSAAGGQILASDLVRVLTGSRLGSLFSPVGALTLKGLAKALDAVEVTWRSRGGEAAIPLPATLDKGGRLSFSGRLPERAALLREWKQAISGTNASSARAVMVSGEPGVGKTRLLREVAADVHRNGAIVLYGQCDEDLGIAYHPFAEAIEEFVTACDRDQLRGMTGPLSGELTRLIPALRQRVPGIAEPLPAEPDTERYRLFQAVVDLFTAMSSVSPVLLVLDDLHWADSQTLLLLRHLLRSNEPMRLLVAGAYRDTDIELGHQLTQMPPDLRRARRGRRVPLSGLDEDGVAEMVAAAADHDLSAGELEFARYLHSETDGHPFCVEEVLLQLAETAASSGEEGSWMLVGVQPRLDIPEGVREVVAQRLARLPDGADAVLEAAAVIGRQFEVRLLSAVADDGMRAVVGALEAAERARLIGPVPGQANAYRFAHTLVRSSIYEDMPTSRRRWLHRDVGLALEGFEGNDERLNELALHFGEAAAVGEADRAVKYARSAADHALAKHAYAQAAAHYARARASLQLSGSQQPELDCDLRLAYAAALYRSGGDDYRKAAFEAASAARAIGDSQRLAEAALLLVHYGPANPVIDPREVALLRDALGGLEDKGDRPARARLLAGLGTALSLLGEERAVALSRQAVDMARRLGDPMVLARVLASHHAAIAGPDVGEERVAVARELVMLGEQLGDPETTFAGHLASYVSLIAVSDIDGANAALELGDRLARELRQPAFAFHILRIRTAQALLAGRVGDGERLTAAMIRKGQEAGIRDSTLAAMSIGLEFIGRELSGRLHELERRISRLAASRPQWLLLQTALAQIQCQNGRPTRARQLLRRLGADGFHGIPRDELWFETIIHLAVCAVHLPDTGAAAALYDLLLPYAGRNTFTGMGSFGPADLTLAQLATSLERYAEAERHFAAAADHCERLRAQGWAAHARYGWARMLMAQGSAANHDRGRELAARALADADELGLTGLAGQLRALLNER